MVIKCTKYTSEKKIDENLIPVGIIYRFSMQVFRSAKRCRTFLRRLFLINGIAMGRLKLTYSVSIPSPLCATHQAFTPTPALSAPSTNSAWVKKVSHDNRFL